MPETRGSAVASVSPAWSGGEYVPATPARERWSEGTSVLTVVGQEGSEMQQEPVSLLDQLVRDDARQMLAAALRAEGRRLH
jgi:hypothetical protein